MELKDKIILGAAIISALIIFVIFAANKVNSDPNAFSTGAYYTPRMTTKVGDNEGNSWSNFAAGNSLECPGIGNTKPACTPISMNGATKYTIIQYFPLTMEELGLTTNVVTLNTAQSVLNLQDVNNTILGDITGLQLVPMHSDNDDYYEIIAPFAFSFDCSNLDEDRRCITIVSSNRQVKIELNNVANWFCAGPVGTPTVYKNSGDDISCNWFDHGDHHATIIGSSKNANKSGGGAGDLIAYGDKSTTMTLSVIENGQWVMKSWYAILKKH